MPSASEKNTANMTPTSTLKPDSALRTDGAGASAAAPIPLTQPKDDELKADVPAATTSGTVTEKPEVANGIPVVPLTSEKADEVELALNAENDRTDEVESTSKQDTSKETETPSASKDDLEAQAIRDAINNAIANPDAAVAPTQQAGKEQAIEEKRVKEEAKQDVKESTPEPEKQGKVAQEAAEKLEATPAGLGEKGNEQEIR